VSEQDFGTGRAANAGEDDVEGRRRALCAGGPNFAGAFNTSKRR